MRGVERRLGQEAHQQFKAGLPGNNGETSRSGQQENAVNDIRGLIERRRGLNLPDINEYVMMWKDLAALTIPSGKEPYRIRVPEEEHNKIVQVSRGIDFVLFNKVSTTQQAGILRELQEHQQNEGMEQFVLSYEEGLLLRDAVAAVNVVYDPGTSKETEKRTFKFSDLEAKASPEAISLRDWYASVGM